jgi:DNA-binding CsgD family transcriptional regulator
MEGIVPRTIVSFPDFPDRRNGLNRSFREEPPMILRLISTDPTLVEAPGYLVPHGKYTVGRGRACDFVIKNLSVSREHAELTASADAVRIVDLESLNGTFVSNARVKKAEIKPGHAVRFGSVEFHLVGQELANDSDSDESTDARPMALGSVAEMAAFTHLSDAQRRVLELLLRGRSEKEVAAKLNLSPHTVHNHVKEIHRRLGVNSRGELMALFVSESKIVKVPGK